MNENILRKYARLAVVSGVNVQKGQLLIINASARDWQFAEYCVEEAYKAGARAVMVEWDDENISHMRYEYMALEDLCEIPDWAEEKVKWQQDNKCAYLHIISNTPGLMADIDPEKMRKTMIAYMSRMQKYQGYTMNNQGQWCVVALPNPKWAKIVFPEKSEEEAVNALWDAILFAVRVREDNDPIREWEDHDNELLKHCAILNAHQFKTLHFRNEKGTDITVGLVKDHVWVGGGCTTPGGVFFNPNMPTEECFCMPDRNNVNGKVYASKPLNYAGKVIEDFWFEFRDGAVVDYGAKKNQDALKQLLETDEGARHLGEVALISCDSPISNLSILFFNTLFDENASCHLALGRCYPENVKGGTEMSEEEVFALGGNSSMEHVDFMFGTADMSVTGIKEDGSEIVVFANGNFAI